MPLKTKRNRFTCEICNRHRKIEFFPPNSTTICIDCVDKAKQINRNAMINNYITQVDTTPHNLLFLYQDPNGFTRLKYYMVINEQRTHYKYQPHDRLKPPFESYYNALLTILSDPLLHIDRVYLDNWNITNDINHEIHRTRYTTPLKVIHRQHPFIISFHTPDEN